MQATHTYKRKSILEILSSPITEVIKLLEDNNFYDPRLGDYELYERAVSVSYQKNLLTVPDTILMDKGLEEYLKQKNILRDSIDYFEENAIFFSGKQEYFAPYFQFLFESDLEITENSWKNALNFLSPELVSEIVSSPLMSQELFNIFYREYYIMQNEYAVGHLSELADNFGFETPDMSPEILSDDTLLRVVLLLDIFGLENLAETSTKMKAFLNKPSTLKALGKKHGYYAESLEDFFNRYTPGLEYTDFEALKYYASRDDAERLVDAFESGRFKPSMSIGGLVGSMKDSKGTLLRIKKISPKTFNEFISSTSKYDLILSLISLIPMDEGFFNALNLNVRYSSNYDFLKELGDRNLLNENNRILYLIFSSKYDELKQYQGNLSYINIDTLASITQVTKDQILEHVPTAKNLFDFLPYVNEENMKGEVSRYVLYMWADYVFKH